MPDVVREAGQQRREEPFRTWEYRSETGLATRIGAGRREEGVDLGTHEDGGVQLGVPQPEQEIGDLPPEDGFGPTAPPGRARRDDPVLGPESPGEDDVFGEVDRGQEVGPPRRNLHREPPGDRVGAQPGLREEVLRFRGGERPPGERVEGREGQFQASGRHDGAALAVRRAPHGLDRRDAPAVGHEHEREEPDHLPDPRHGGPGRLEKQASVARACLAGPSAVQNRGHAEDLDRPGRGGPACAHRRRRANRSGRRAGEPPRTPFRRPPRSRRAERTGRRRRVESCTRTGNSNRSVG